MIDSDVFVQALQDMGVNFFTGVPDSILGGIIEELMTRKAYTPAVREDEADRHGRRRLYGREDSRRPHAEFRARHSLEHAHFPEYDVSASLHSARLLAGVPRKRCAGAPRHGRDDAARCLIP